MEGCCFQQALLWGVLATGSLRRQAGLVEADFRSSLDQLTDLGKANLSGSDPAEANLTGCDLRATYRTGAKLEGTRLEDAQLP